MDKSHHYSAQVHQYEEAPITAGRTIRWARHYDGFVRMLAMGREEAFRKQTIERAAIPAGAFVLDVGCGTGTLTLLVRHSAGSEGRVYGVDAASEMIEVARQKAAAQHVDVDFRVGVIEALPFEDGSIDVVLSSLMFHHLPQELKQRGLEEIFRVLTPGGRLLIVDMKYPTSLARRMALVALIHHSMESGINDLIAPMEAIGYTSVKTGNMSWGSIGFVQGSRPL